MSFYDPLAPAFEATRLEIERTIMGLEERLLRRKQLDIQMQKDLIEQQNLQRLRLHQAPLYNHLESKYIGQIELERRLRDLGTLDTREHLIRNYAQRQTLQLDYLTRLRQIQKQQSTLDKQFRIKLDSNGSTVPYSLPQRHYNNNNNQVNPLDQSGQMLARKYFDGTRAYEYNQQLKRSADKQDRFTKPNNLFTKPNNFGKDNHNNQVHNKQLFNQTIKPKNKQREPDHSTVKKYEQSQRKQTSQQYESNNHKSFTISKQSPIKQIYQSSNYNSNTGKIINLNQEKQHAQSQHKHNAIQQKQQEFYSNDNSPQLEPKHIKRSRTKSTQPTNQQIYIPDGTSYSRQSRSRSRPKSSTKPSQYLSNRQKSSHSLHYHSVTKSALQSLSQNVPINQKFKLWFRERSRLAEQAKQVYEIRYAKNLPEYLWTVYQKEDKLRKELKEKICKMPAVERKYDVGPVAQ